MIQLLAFSFSCYQLFPYNFFMHDPKRTLFYVFNLSFEKYLVSYSVCFCSKKKITSKKIPDSLDFFSLLFLLNLFSFFVSSLFVYSNPCLYSSYSLFFSMPPLLLFALFMFIYSLLCFFCLCLFLFFDFLNLCYLFFVFC